MKRVIIEWDGDASSILMKTEGEIDTIDLLGVLHLALYGKTVATVTCNKQLTEDADDSTAEQKGA